MYKGNKNAKITEENSQEAARLKAIWEKGNPRMSQATFGEKYNIGSPGAVYQFLKGITPLSMKAAIGFAEGLGCQISDFSPRLAREAKMIGRAVQAYQVVPPDQTKQSGNETSVFEKESNIAPIDPKIVGASVPIITFEQAATWDDVSAPYEPSTSTRWLPCPIPHGPRAYGVDVEGENMSNPGNKPSYEPGETLFVDPDRQPVSGSRVVALISGQKRAVFRQYIEEGDQRYLKSLNPEIKPRYTNEDFKVCGVVIGKVTWED